MALRMCYKSFSEYLGTLVVVAGDFGLGGLAGYLENSDSEGVKELWGAIEGCSRWK